MTQHIPELIKLAHEYRDFAYIMAGVILLLVERWIGRNDNIKACSILDALENTLKKEKKDE